MPTRFLLIRHGQSANNALPEHQRVHDPGLTDLGQEQAECVARKLATLEVTRIIVSPFRRTLQTAWPAIGHLQVPSEIWVEVHEQGGCYSGHLPTNIRGERGMTRSEIAEEFPGITCPTNVGSQGWWPSSTRETEVEATRRVQGVVVRLQKEFRDPNQCIAIFTHADFKSLFCETVDPNHRAGAPNNGSISHFRSDELKLSLESFNHIEHLGDELLSV